MNASLQQACETLVANEELVRKGNRLEFEHLIKLGGLLYLNQGLTPDPARIKACRGILKKKASFFSNFRGWLEFVVRLKMSVVDDPEGYFDDVQHIYGILKQGRMLPGDMIAMAAMCIKDNCPAEHVDEVSNATRDAWWQINKAHPILTNDGDMSLIALMCIAGMDADAAAAQAEEIFQALREKGIPREASQACAMVLALSPKSTDQKVAHLVEFYDALKKAKRTPTIRHDGSTAIYAAFADVDAPIDTLVSQIAEVDDWLRSQKGYGPMGVGKELRRVIAASLVLSEYQKELASSLSASMGAAITQTIAEEIVIMIITVIIISIIINTSHASH